MVREQWREQAEKRKSQKKEDQGARKGRKVREVAIHRVFPMCCGAGRSKSRHTKAAGAKASGRTRNQKLHAFVAQSTFRGQKVQNTSVSELLGDEMSKKCVRLWCEAQLEIKMSKKTQYQSTARS